IDPDVSTGLLHEAVDLRKPKPCSLANFLGGEKWIEGFRHHLRGHPYAGIADENAHVLSRGHFSGRAVSLVKVDVGGFDRQLSPSGNGLRAMTGRLGRTLSGLV